ncbi:MAG: winged helix DNA-binding protein [Terracidiphilus sp.]
MPESTPSRSLLEIFILFCVKIGFGTTYLIMSQMGVGAGASVNQLKDLKNKGLLTSSLGPRRQVFFSLTEAGELVLLDALERSPTDSVTATYGIYGGLPRIVFFSWLRGRLDEARAALNLTESGLGRKAEDADREAERCREILNPPKDVIPARQESASPEYLAAAYRLIAALASSADAKRKLEALGTLRQLIDELPPQPRTFLNEVKVRAEGSTIESGSTLPQEK